MSIASDPAPTAPLAPEDLREIAQSLAGEFAAARPADGPPLEVAALDPFRLRVRWRAPESAGAAPDTPDAPLVLRFRRCGAADGVSAAEGSYDILPGARAGERTFAFRRGGETFTVEFGRRRADGGLDPLARAGPVSTPPAGPSPAGDLVLVDVRRPDAALPQLRVWSWVIPSAAPPAAGAPSGLPVPPPTTPSPAAPSPAATSLATRTNGSGAPAAAAPPPDAAPWP